MRRPGLFGVVVLVGFGVLIGAAAFGGEGALSGLLAAPLAVVGFMFQALLFLLLFGLVMKIVVGRRVRRSVGWSSRPRWSQPPEDGRLHPRHGWCGRSEGGADTGDRFEEWHRMAHARKEVDDHTPPFEG